MLKTKTPHAIYGGVGLEKPYARCIIAWDKTDTHNGFIKSSDYPILGERLVPSFVNPKNPDPTALFDAPVTELVIATTRPGASSEGARAVVDTFAQKIAAESGVISVTVGEVEESPERFVVLVGRQSRQDGIAEEYNTLTDGQVDVTVEWAQFQKKQ